MDGRQWQSLLVVLVMLLTPLAALPVLGSDPNEPDGDNDDDNDSRDDLDYDILEEGHTSDPCYNGTASSDWDHDNDCIPDKDDKIPTHINITVPQVLWIDAKSPAIFRGYVEWLNMSSLAFEPAPCGQAVEAVVLSGTRTIVPSGTDPSCYQEPKPHLTSSAQSGNRPLNLESNKESNFCRRAPSGENRPPTSLEEEEHDRQTASSTCNDGAVSKSDPPARKGSEGAS